MSIPNRRGPRALSEILGELLTVRGYGRFWARQELEEAWNAAVGEPLCRQTQLGEVRRGVLNVTVAHPALREELAAFRKPALLAALRSGAPGTMVHDIRFRVGTLESGAAETASGAPEPSGSPEGPELARRDRPQTRPNSNRNRSRGSGSGLP